MSSELQAVADGLAARLNKGVAIEDSSLRLLVHTPQHGNLDRPRIASILHQHALPEIVAYVRALNLRESPEPVVRLRAEPTLDMMARVCAPLRADGEFLGYLTIIDDEQSVTDAELRHIAEAARSAAMIVIKDRRLESRHIARDRTLLANLISDDVRTSEDAAATIVGTYGDFGRAGRALLISVSPTTAPPLSTSGPTSTSVEELVVLVDAALERSARRVLGRQFLQLVQPGTALLLTTEPAGSSVDGEVAAALREHLLSSLGPAEIRVGVGGLATSPEQLRTTYEQAGYALDIANRVPGFGPSAVWDDLGIYQLLVRLPVPVLEHDAIPASLLPLLTRSAGRSLAHTVEVYLDNAGDAQETIAILCTHRTTLYYRLGRFTELTGLDLNSGYDRLAVHLGLKVARLTGAW